MVTTRGSSAPASMVASCWANNMGRAERYVVNQIARSRGGNNLGPLGGRSTVRVGERRLAAAVAGAGRWDSRLLLRQAPPASAAWCWARVGNEAWGKETPVGCGWGTVLWSAGMGWTAAGALNVSCCHKIKLGIRRGRDAPTKRVGWGIALARGEASGPTAAGAGSTACGLGCVATAA